MPISRQILQQIAEEKAADASLLLSNGRFANAYYLAGFAIEIALKAVISRRFRADEYPDKSLVKDLHIHHIHEFSRLVSLAGLTMALEKKRELASFDANWSLLVQWHVDSRYAIIEAAKAEAMVNAVTSRDDGVLQWIRSYW
jgi:HEPN domain-containing protein